MIYGDFAEIAKQFSECVENNILWEEHSYVKDVNYKFEVGEKVVYVGRHVKVIARFCTADKRIFYKLSKFDSTPPEEDIEKIIVEKEI